MLDYMSRAAEAIGALAGWVQAGKIKNKVDVQHGLENAPATLRRLCLRAATRVSNCCASPSSSPQQMGLPSTTLSAEAAEAGSRKLEPSRAVGFN